MSKVFGRLRDTLTAAVFLRRISRELHRMNELEELRLSCEFPNQFKAYKSSGVPNFSRAPTKMVGISSPTFKDWDDNYKQKRGLDSGQGEDDDVFNHP